MRFFEIFHFSKKNLENIFVAIFFGVEIFFGHSFDVKNCVLSIYEVSGAFRVLIVIVIHDSALMV